MNENLVDVTILLDRSGSMVACTEATIKGFNEFINSQMKVPGQCNLSLIQFDDRYEPDYIGIPITVAKQLNKDTYVPRGSTALIGAIGKTIDELGVRLSNIQEVDKPKQVLFVVITDGQENDSCNNQWSCPYNRNRVATMLKHQKEVYSWQFVFMGANQDAILTGTSLNIDIGSSQNFTSTPIGMTNAMRSLSSNTSKYRAEKTQLKDKYFEGKEHADDN